MNIISIDNYRASQRIHPLSLLAQMSSRQASGCLRVSDGSTLWWIYLSNGELIHAAYSQHPFERLEYHLDKMGHGIPNLGEAIYRQLQTLFNTVPEPDIDWLNPPDYGAIRWLTEQGHLTVPQSTLLLEAIAKEVFGTFLQVREGSHELVDCSKFMNSSLLPLLELRPLVEGCQKRIRENETIRPTSASKYPVPLTEKESSQPNSDLNNRLGMQEPPTHFGSLPNSSNPTNPSVTANREISSDVQPTTKKSGVSLGVNNIPVQNQKSALFGVNGSSTPSSTSSNNQFMSTQVPSQSLTSPIIESTGQSSDSATQFGQPTSQAHKSFSSPSPTRISPQSSGRPSSIADRLRRHPPTPHPLPPSAKQPQFLRTPTEESLNPAPTFYRESNAKNDSQSLRNAETKNQGPSSLEYASNLDTSSLNPPKSLGEKVYKVACIDDSPMILHMIEAFLEDKSFSVIKINDPVRALMELMRAKPDIILLDITMPNLDGYELCTLLRSRADFRNTPIIMVTGSKGLIDRAKARLVKASGYLTKPFNQTQLLKMVFKLLK